MKAAPPKLVPLSLNSKVAIAFLAVGGAATAGFIYFFDPSQSHVYPVCQFHQLTGLNCPGCGATRGLYALLHGDLATAARDNLLLVAGIAGTALRGGWFAWNRHRRGTNPDFFPPRWLIPLVGIVILFGVLRNLPWFAPYLSPP